MNITSSTVTEKYAYAVALEVADGPVLHKQYARTIRYQVQTVHMIWTSENGEPWQQGGITLAGLRVLKDGSFGDRVREVYHHWSSAELPTEIADAVRDATPDPRSRRRAS
jgi:hypothetical protein